MLKENKELNVKYDVNKDTNKLMSIGSSILKVVGGFYIIGVIIGLNDLMMTVIGPMMEKLAGTSLFTSTLKPWADIVFGPILYMIGLLPWFIPVVLLSMVVVWLVSKLKFVNKKELKVFIIILTVTLLKVL